MDQPEIHLPARRRRQSFARVEYAQRDSENDKIHQSDHDRIARQSAVLHSDTHQRLRQVHACGLERDAQG